MPRTRGQVCVCWHARGQVCVCGSLRCQVTPMTTNTDLTPKKTAIADLTPGLAVLLLCWLIAGCGQARPEGDAIVVGMTNSAVNLDPRVGADEASQKAHQLLFNTLVKIDANLKVVPELAESLE